MKRRVVAGLVRLYPSRWRAEYGEELAEILMRRPLGARALLDVAVGAARQHEPWVLVGVPLTLWVVFSWVRVLTGAGLVSRRGAPELGVAVFFGVGLWTVARYGHGGGRAAMKVAMLVALPFLTLGVLALAQVLRVADGPGGMLHFRLYGPANYATPVFGMFVESAILQIPIAGLIGWCGGFVGQLARRLARVRI